MCAKMSKIDIAKRQDKITKSIKNYVSKENNLSLSLSGEHDYDFPIYLSLNSSVGSMYKAYVYYFKQAADEFLPQIGKRMVEIAEEELAQCNKEAKAELAKMVDVINNDGDLNDILN